MRQARVALSTLSGPGVLWADSFALDLLQLASLLSSMVVAVVASVLLNSVQHHLLIGFKSPPIVIIGSLTDQLKRIVHLYFTLLLRVTPLHHVEDHQLLLRVHQSHV